MHTQHGGHSVILFRDADGGWNVAEIDGPSVDRLGPFASRQAADELVSILFPDVPRVELHSASDGLDDTALMVLGNGELMAKRAGVISPEEGMPDNSVHRKTDQVSEAPAVDAQFPL